METKHADLNSLKIDRSRPVNEYTQARKRKLFIWAGIVVVLLVAVIILISSWDKLFSPAVEVELTIVSLQSPSQSDAVLTASGYVVAQRKAAVASKGTGRLVYLGVVEGDKVKENEIIARLEDNDIRAQLDEANANLKLYEAKLLEVENNFNRQQELFNQKVISESQLENAETNYRSILASINLAKAQIQSIEVALENMIIRAPFDGTVLTKNADVGEIVAPLAAGVNSRAAVVTIADMTSLQVEADVSESNIQKITVGHNCEITLDAYSNVRYAGFVAKIVPTADRSKATVMVKVGFKDYDSKVLPEMSAKVLFLKEKEKMADLNEPPVLMVSGSAIVTRDDKKVVYKLIDKKAVEIQITTGREFSGYVEILSGLENGEQVIDSPGKEIVDGISVKEK